MAEASTPSGAVDPSITGGNTIALQEASYEVIQDGRVYDELHDGQAIDIEDTGSLNETYIVIDEENLGLERVTIENLQKGWEAQGESFTRGLEEAGITVDSFAVFKWYQIQRKVFQTLGQPNADAQERIKRFEEGGGRLNLSETKGFAMCSEYAALSAYIAHKIGERARLIFGASTPEEGEWRESHAYVWADGVSAVFDGVQARTDNEFPALMMPVTPVTFEALEAGLDIEGQRIGTDFTAHYGLQAGGFDLKSAHEGS